VSLPADQQRQLTAIEGALVARDPKLASMFSIFTRLHRGDEVPRHERVTRRVTSRVQPLRSLMAAPAEGRGLTRPLMAVPFALLACVFAAIVVLAMSGANAQACAPPLRYHGIWTTTGRSCQPSVVIPNK
jgi:hypothetical protein